MNKIGLVCAVAAISGCIQQPNNPVAQIPTTGTQSATLSQLSCVDLEARLNSVAVQANQLEAQRSQSANQNAIANAALNVGVGVLIGRAGGGNLDSIRTASAIGTGMQGVLSPQAGQGQLTSAGDSIALARQSAEIQRAMIRRGC